jgi:hypothetical protein
MAHHPSPRRTRRPPSTPERFEDRTLPASFLSIAADMPSVPRPDTGSTVATFTVTLSPANLQQTVTVDYTTADGTATAANGDYVPTKGTLTFPPDATTETVRVTIPAKTVAEPKKTFSVVLSNPAPPNVTFIQPGQGTATETIIGHPAGEIGFSTSDYQASASDGSATITVTRFDDTQSGLPLGGGVGVTFATVAGGTAVPGVDYQPVTGTLPFGFNQSTATFNVPLLVDPFAFTDRTVELMLSNPTGGATLNSDFTFATLTIHPANPLIVTNTLDSGIGSLRQAILSADSIPTPTPVTITFKIPGANPHTITPPSPLPPITRPVTIDATTQPGFVSTPVIFLDGSALASQSGASGSASGLVVLNVGTPTRGGGVTAGSVHALQAGSGSTIRGMAIGNFPGAGIFLQGSGGNVIEQDDLGTDTSGAVAAPNGLSGVLVVDSVDNLIGGLSAGLGDVISGNTTVGVWIVGAKARGNVVVGNRIGTDAGGTKRLDNGLSGVLIAGAGGNLVGGTTPAAANVISGNGSVGVMINGSAASGNVVMGNLIGTDVSGKRAVPNVDDGVFLVAAPGNLIGGTVTGAGNVISGNGSVGVEVFGAPGLGNTIEGNTIGADITGAAALANGNDGVFLDGAPGNFLGGNLVSGNGSVGVQIFGPGASGNVLLGNKIGTDATGRAALPNARDGLFLNGAPGNVVGGPAAGAGNLISGNGSVGVQIFDATASGNVLMGNTIGADVTGAAALPNPATGSSSTAPRATSSVGVSRGRAT